MAAIPSESATASCAHCGKDVPASNIQLHQAHCARNLERCKICGDMVTKKHIDDHYFSNHAPVDCLQCSEKVDREVLAIHEAEHCPRRIITCQYCDFPSPAVDLLKHQEICGNRTNYCHSCNQYVRLCEQADHEIHFHCTSNGAPESSRFLLASLCVQLCVVIQHHIIRQYSGKSEGEWEEEQEDLILFYTLRPSSKAAILTPHLPI